MYSELAASWLWVVALGGAVLWWGRRRRAPARSPELGSRAWMRRRHMTLGVTLLAALLFLSATGMTWSTFAGANVTALRGALNWGTPSVTTTLTAASAATGEHADHVPASTSASGGPNPALFQPVLSAARSAGIDAAKVEIAPPTKPDRAWTVTEVDRTWPSQVDAAAVDARTLAVTDRTDFASFPFAAKLTRWGIDAHMGVLFGAVNQAVLLVVAGGLSWLVVLGYRMWWARRPTRSVGAALPPGAWRKAPLKAKVGVVLLGAAAAWFAPVFGVTLLAFLVFDTVRMRVRQAPARAR